MVKVSAERRTLVMMTNLCRNILNSVRWTAMVCCLWTLTGARSGMNRSPRMRISRDAMRDETRTMSRKLRKKDAIQVGCNLDEEQ